MTDKGQKRTHYEESKVKIKQQKLASNPETEFSQIALVRTVGLKKRIFPAHTSSRMEQLLKHTPYALPHMTQPLENSFKEPRITQSLEKSLKESTKRPQTENVSLKHSKVSNKSSRLTVHASKSGFQKGLSPLNNPRLNISTDAPLVDHSYREMLKSS